MAEWTRNELTVLLAIFVSQPFSAGDDGTRTNARIAEALDRSAGAIDRQWRNVRWWLYRLDLYGVPSNVGQNVKDIVDEYRTDLARLRRDALEAMDRNGWALEDLLARAD
jgi:hypothetical protein